MKRWTQLEARTGGAVSPGLLNDDMRAQQGAASTLDRSQLPQGWLDDTRLVDGALHQVWAAAAYPPAPAAGEQQQERDDSTPANAWISITMPVARSMGTWVSISSSPLVLSGFRGGSLFFEWSCNVVANNIFARGVNDGYPGSPNYVRLRIVVNGIVIAERRGASMHQATRLVGTADLPPGDLSVELQYQITPPSEDAANTTQPGDTVPYGHLWNSRYLAIGRYR